MLNITAPFVARINALRQYAGTWTWGPLVHLSRTTILSLLKSIHVGQLIVTDENGELILCGGNHGTPQEKASPRTELQIHDEAFWVRLLLFADMVLAYFVLSLTMNIFSQLSRASLKATCWGNSPAQT